MSRYSKIGARLETNRNPLASPLKLEEHILEKSLGNRGNSFFAFSFRFFVFVSIGLFTY